MELERVSYIEALPYYKKYYKKFNYGIDGYYEKMILNSEHYLLLDRGTVGIVSICEKQLTGFYIFDDNKIKYIEYLSFVLNQDTVKRILFSTIDAMLFQEITDRNLKIEYQAYNFVIKTQVNTNFRMEVATTNQLGFLIRNFIDFIENSMGCSTGDFNRKLANSEIFIGYDINDNPVSMGILDQMVLNPNRYCIGMVVLDKHRRKGYGTKTLQFLINYLQNDSKEVNARCWYYNEASKKTLLKAGFEVSNLLLRVEEPKW